MEADLPGKAQDPPQRVAGGEMALLASYMDSRRVLALYLLGFRYGFDSLD